MSVKNILKEGMVMLLDVFVINFLVILSLAVISSMFDHYLYLKLDINKYPKLRIAIVRLGLVVINVSVITYLVFSRFTPFLDGFLLALKWTTFVGLVIVIFSLAYHWPVSSLSLRPKNY